MLSVTTVSGADDEVVVFSVFSGHTLDITTGAGWPTPRAAFGTRAVRVCNFGVEAFFSRNSFGVLFFVFMFFSNLLSKLFCRCHLQFPFAPPATQGLNQLDGGNIPLPHQLGLRSPSRQRATVRIDDVEEADN